MMIDIDLTALSYESIVRLSNIIDNDLNDVPNETNEEALELIQQYLC